MHNDIIDLLFHPGLFFERKASEKPDYLIPIFIVGAGWAFSLLTPFVMTAFSRGHNVQNMIAIPSVSWLLLFNPFIAWILISLGLFGLSRVLSGTGTFLATLSRAGYGILPLTLIAVLELVTSPLSNPSVALATSPGIGLSVILGTVILSLILTLWSGYLWMYAVEKTHAISHGKAMVAAGFVTFFYIVWTFAWTLNIPLALMAGR
jgi:hypothetical protein